MKLCSRCGVSKEVSAFHRHGSTRDGLDPRCKDCVRTLKADAYAQNREAMLARNQAWKDRSKEHISNYNQHHYATNTVRYQARRAVMTAVAAGRLQRSTNCNRCGAEATTQGHHASYERDQWLNVEWLCRQCHLRHHAQEDAAQ